MPLPTPNGGESKSDFIERCMSNETMQAEYPDDDQRLAVCESQWVSRAERQQTRGLCLEPQLRAVEREEGGLPTLTGYAAIFDSLSEEMWGMYERIAPGAFGESIANGSDVAALVNHDGGLATIGRSKNGSLRLREDEHGLFVEIDPADTQAGRDAVELVRRGDLDKMSFGFIPIDSRIEREDGKDVIIQERVELFDVSLVNFPAYRDTFIGLKQRSIERARAEIEAAKRDGARDIRLRHRWWLDITDLADI